MNINSKICHKYINRSIFVIGMDGLKSAGDITIYEELEDLNEHLKLLSPISETEVIVIHGTITPAEYIPADIGKYIYIIVQDPGNEGMGCIYEIECNEDIDVLSSFVSKIIHENGVLYPNLTIDNIFVMYGYELNLGYSVHEDEIDEEALEGCQNVAEQVKKMMMRTSIYKGENDSEREKGKKDN